MLPVLPELPALPTDATLPPGDGPGLGEDGEGVPVLLQKDETFERFETKQVSAIKKGQCRPVYIIDIERKNCKTG